MKLGTAWFHMSRNKQVVWFLGRCSGKGIYEVQQPPCDFGGQQELCDREHIPIAG